MTSKILKIFVLKAEKFSGNRLVLLFADCGEANSILRQADAMGQLSKGWVWILDINLSPCLEKIQYEGILAPTYQIEAQISFLFND